jgi:hypothetical protein
VAVDWPVSGVRRRETGVRVALVVRERGVGDFDQAVAAGDRIGRFAAVQRGERVFGAGCVGGGVADALGPADGIHIVGTGAGVAGDVVAAEGGAVAAGIGLAGGDRELRRRPGCPGSSRPVKADRAGVVGAAALSPVTELPLSLAEVVPVSFCETLVVWLWLYSTLRSVPLEDPFSPRL